jgi:dolichol kinase
MFGVIVSSLLAGLILLITEKAAKEKKLSLELSRKIPHVAGSLAIATWPFFVSMQTVAVLGLVFTVAALAVIKLKLFPHARLVDRRSWGEVLFGLGVTFAALIGPNKWVFATAMLYLGVADSVAALVGKHKGKRSYQLFGQIKTIEGSLAFLVAAAAITSLAIFVAPTGLEWAWVAVIILPLGGTIIEGCAPLGLDNLLLPVFVSFMLTST